MDILKNYVVYELNPILDSKEYMTLKKVEFKGCIINRFNTEDEAIQALINDEKIFEDYLIIKQIFIRSI